MLNEINPQVVIATHLRYWHGLALEVCSTSGMKLSNKGSIMQLAAAQCASTQRTKAGVLVDYTIFLAGFGIEPDPKSIERVRGSINKSQRTALDRGLRKAREIHADMKAAREREAAAK